MTKILPLILILLLTGCSSDEQANSEPSPPTVAQQARQQPRPAFQSISPTQAMHIIGNKTDLLILDTRTTREIIQYGAVPGSEQADIRSIVNNGLPNPKNQPILVVCAVGGRSYAVGKFLVKQGHTEIYNLSGGLSQWKNQGLPVVFPKK